MAAYTSMLGTTRLRDRMGVIAPDHQRKISRKASREIPRKFSLKVLRKISEASSRGQGETET
jgi:hypothetical protein